MVPSNSSNSSEDWNNLTDAQVLELVWSKPTNQLAEEFGIPIPAIVKRCRNGKIPKPPRGFWARVKAGKIEHPNGKIVSLEPMPGQRLRKPKKTKKNTN